MTRTYVCTYYTYARPCTRVCLLHRTTDTFVWYFKTDYMQLRVITSKLLFLRYIGRITTHRTTYVHETCSKVQNDAKIRCSIALLISSYALRMCLQNVGKNVSVAFTFLQQS